MKGKILIFLVSTLLSSLTFGARLGIVVNGKSGGTLDLYTSPERFHEQLSPFVGEGPNEPCDAFFLGDNVTLYAEIIWDGEPLNSVLVAFEILWEWELVDHEVGFPYGYSPKNESVAYRIAETNETGIATSWFTVPTASEYPMFGKWLIIASAIVQAVKLEDTMRFDVGYILEIADLATLKNSVPETTFTRGVDAIEVFVYVQNIALIPKPVSVVVTAYDEGDVPVGQAIIQRDIWTGEYCSPEYARFVVEIPVPDWANVGPDGHVYINIFTRLPSDGGVRYAPEVMLPLIIDF